jgi:hypothetical protein
VLSFVTTSENISDLWRNYCDESAKQANCKVIRSEGCKNVIEAIKSISSGKELCRFYGLQLLTSCYKNENKTRGRSSISQLHNLIVEVYDNQSEEHQFHIRPLLDEHEFTLNDGQLS